MGILDSSAGQVFAATLHTAGAIAFLAGLMVFVAWARGIRRGDEHISLLTLGATLSYVAILANLTGGFIRTYAPGHPKFWEAFNEPWAMLMVIKHIFLFGGMFAIVYLFEMVAPRLRRHQAEGHNLVVGRRESAAVAFCAMSILVATVLGAVAAITPISSMEMEEPENPVDPVQVPADPNGVLFTEQQYVFNGTITSVPPIQPGTSDGTLQMPSSVARAVATLTWSDDVAVLNLQMTGPQGTSSQGPGAEGKAEIVLTNPTSGRWAFSVSGENAVNVAYTLTVILTPSENPQILIADTVVIPTGTIFEINLEAPLHGNISWEWQIVGGQDIAFNLHTHFDGEVQYVVEKTTNMDTGRYQVIRGGGHSLMWDNPNGVPMQLKYRAWGNFEVDSYFPSSSAISVSLVTPDNT